MTRVAILPSAEAAAVTVATCIADALQVDPELVIGLPTGQTPIPMYRALVELHRQGRADFARATTFNLDEFVGVAPGDPGSYHAYMRAHLFDAINLAPERMHLFNGKRKDWRREIARFDAALSALGGLTIAVVGIGRNGHIGFNEPAPALATASHRVRLTEASRRANAAAFGGRWRRVPTHALSMGIGSILRARTVLLLATGAHKAAIVARALHGPITTRVPASLLQAHPNVLVVLDRAAAGKLPMSERRLSRGSTMKS